MIHISKYTQRVINGAIKGVNLKSFKDATPDEDKTLAIYENDRFLTLAEYQKEENNLKYWDLRTPIEIEIGENFTWEYEKSKSIRPITL